MRIIRLIDLTENQFNQLKGIGMLWELYPEDPEFYEDIKRN